MTSKLQDGDQRARRGGRAAAAIAISAAVVALTFAEAPADAVVPPTTAPPTPTVVLPPGPIGRPTTTSTTSTSTTTAAPTTTEPATTTAPPPTEPAPPSSAPTPPPSTAPPGPDVSDLEPINLSPGPCTDAIDDYYTVAADQALEVSTSAGVGQNDFTCEGMDYGFGEYTPNGPDHGALAFDLHGGFTYTPNPGFTGKDSFVYAFWFGGSSVLDHATVHITVAPNCTVIAESDAYATQQDAPLVEVEPGFLDNDAIACPVSGVEVATPTTHGELTMASGSGGFAYTPIPGFFGVDTFGYRIVDADAKTLAAGTVTITVTPPTPCWDDAADDYYGVAGDAMLISHPARVLDNDPRCGIEVYRVVQITEPEHGDAHIDQDFGDVFYEADSGYSGTDSFSYALMRDDLPIDVATVHLNVSAGCGFVAVADHYSTPADTTLSLSNGGFLDNDADMCTLYSYEIGEAGHGYVALTDGHGTFDYSPEFGFVGTDSFTYEVYDPGNGSEHHTLTIGTVYIDVQAPAPVNDALESTTTISTTTSSTEGATTLPATTDGPAAPTTTAATSLPPDTTPATAPALPADTSDPATGDSVVEQRERVFTLTTGGTNPAVPGWTSLTGPNYELWSDGSLYFRGATDDDRLYPEVLFAALDDTTMARLVELLDAVDLDTVGGTTEFSTSLTHPPVAILVAGDGTADETFTSYRIAERGELPPEITALVALIDELDALVASIDAEPLTSGRAIIVAQPTTTDEDGDPSAWPASVEWSAMPPSIGDARCVVIEGDEVAPTLDAYQIPHGPDRAFDTGDGTLVVTGIRALMPSEPGCPPPS